MLTMVNKVKSSLRLTEILPDFAILVKFGQPGTLIDKGLNQTHYI